MPDLAPVLDALTRIAPLRLAGGWDNVGLLLEGTRPIRTLGVTIDLTEAVAAELIAADCDLIVSYHPPIFSGLKRLTEAAPRQRTLLKLVRAGVHLYSPHSALDAAEGGMAEWLLEPFGPLADVAPIAPDALAPHLGAGRHATLATPRPLHELLPLLRAHLGLPAVRVASTDPTRPIARIAVCPGAGGSLFAGLTDIDLFLTGEMRHHDVLARFEQGEVVVLTDHTNTERGYLPRLATRLHDALGVPVVQATRDRDPLRIDP